MKATFDKIKLRFGAYHDLNDAQETLLFNRVQGGMALSPSGSYCACCLHFGAED